jgi:hypothetical protein
MTLERPSLKSPKSPKLQVAVYKQPKITFPDWTIPYYPFFIRILVTLITGPVIMFVLKDIFNNIFKTVIWVVISNVIVHIITSSDKYYPYVITYFIDIKESPYNLFLIKCLQLGYRYDAQ